MIDFLEIAESNLERPSLLIEIYEMHQRILVSCGDLKEIEEEVLGNFEAYRYSKEDDIRKWVK